MKRLSARITVHDITSEVRRELAALGFAVDPFRSRDLDCPERFSYVQIFKVDEAQLRSPALQDWIRRRNANITVLGHMEYTAQDLAQAAWLDMLPNNSALGYPQPDNPEDGEPDYLDLTYDRNAPGYCPRCNMYKVQRAPFRIKSEPRAKAGAFGLHWIFDEIFVRPEVYEAVFRPFGLDYWPVLHHRSGRPLETVLQLKIDKISESPRALAAMMGGWVETCPVCHRTKYPPHFPGPPPGFLGPPGPWPVFKSQEHFGSEYSARRGVIVSNDL